MADDPRDVWSRPHGSPTSTGDPAPSAAPADTPLAQRPMSDGNWWYQYPSGQWIWWSAEKNAWVPVEVTRSAPTRWWVYALVIIAALILIVSFIGAIISRLPELQEEIERQQQDQISVLGY